MAQTEVIDFPILTLSNTVATRKYPFTAEGLSKLKDLRAEAEAAYLAEFGEAVVVPAPVILEEAIAFYHQFKFGA